MHGINNPSPRPLLGYPVISGCLTGLGRHGKLYKWEATRHKIGKLYNTTTKGKGLFMKTAIKRGIGYTVMWGLLAHVPLLSYAATNGTVVHPPVITKEPVDRMVRLGTNVTFTVEAQPGQKKEELTYQWLFNCIQLNDEANHILGATNSSLIIYNVTTNDVGFYSCAVHREPKDEEYAFVMTQPALLMACSSNSPVTIWSYPPPGGGSTGTVCPAPYLGYINFYVPCPPPVDSRCGFEIDALTPKQAKDTTRSDTKISYLGSSPNPLDFGCGTNGLVTINPVNSATYTFCVYFPSSMPTSAYPLQLIGFKLPPETTF